MKAPWYLLLVLTGCALCAWGLPVAHRWSAPRNLLPALAVLAGVVLLMLGWLLTAVPGFFGGTP